MAADGEGEIITSEVDCSGPNLFLTADATHGSITAEIQHPDGSFMRGFEMNQCQPMTRDSVRARLAWKTQADVQPLLGRTFRLRLRLQNATLYALYAA